MKVRPTIFLSGVSHEFGSFRDAVENELEMKGCFAENQPGFPPDYRTVEEMLRRKLHDSDAVIHIVGFRYGAEPNQRPPGVPRRSYTQMEFDIARELQKPVYIFLSADASARQPPPSTEQPEDADTQALQLAHRTAVRATNYLYYFFKDQAELCKLAAEIPIVASAAFRADISRIDKYAPAELIGRETEITLLREAWVKVRRAESARPRILTFVALGGEGKTSLVAKWLAELAHQGWPACDSAFAWSFYSQGTREQVAANSDLFLKEALNFFGDDEDKAFAASPAAAFEKGQRLARLVAQRRTLLILDGLEPLQYSSAATAFKPGELKDQGLAKLLKDLAANNQGLCIVTTRIELPDLQTFKGGAVIETHLKRLSRSHGVDLLKKLGNKGSELRTLPLNEADPESEKVNEFEKLVEDVKGHALTLTILGGFLKRAFQGDIRKRDRIKFEKADEKIDGGHAFRTMAAYEQWLLRDGGDEGRREVAVLRLLGLFDRPADSGCVAALLQAPAIPGLTEPLVGVAEDDWQFCLTGLESAKLLTINPGDSNIPHSIDAHPHLREYFARQLRTQQPDAWRAAHRRLYEHLCATTQEGDQPTLEDLQPLYQAVAHGCHAGLQQEAYDDVHLQRIRRGGPVDYACHKLGAFAAELGALACFFESPWSKPSANLKARTQGILVTNSAFRLRALSRLTEAIEPMRASVKMGVEAEDWEEAAIRASNLSELELTLGEVAMAVSDAELSVTYADRSSVAFKRMVNRTTYADALLQAGRRAEAETRFREAEQIQAWGQPAYPLLYSLPGFRYCDLLLAALEGAAWQLLFNLKSKIRNPKLADFCHTITQRATQTFQWMGTWAPLLDFALNHLTIGRAALFAAILESGTGVPPVLVEDSPSQDSHATLATARRELDTAVTGLRRAGTQDHLPRGLLARASLRFLTGTPTGPASAQEDLDEAWQIAERGPMRLHMADIHLHRARLFYREPHYPWQSPQHDLAEARRLIHRCGYHRRDEELADAETVINALPPSAP